jgi:hypothetical protein
MVTVTGVHLTVARRRTFGVPTLYMGIIMAWVTLWWTLKNVIRFSLF